MPQHSTTIHNIVREKYTNEKICNKTASEKIWYPVWWCNWILRVCVCVYVSCDSAKSIFFWHKAHNDNYTRCDAWHSKSVSVERWSLSLPWDKKFGFFFAIPQFIVCLLWFCCFIWNKMQKKIKQSNEIWIECHSVSEEQCLQLELIAKISGWTLDWKEKRSTIRYDYVTIVLVIFPFFFFVLSLLFLCVS